MIDCILSFLIEHWIIIIPCFLGLVEFVFLLIFKRRPEIVANDLVQSIVVQCREAEKRYGHGNGDLKLKQVLNYFQVKLGNNFGYFKSFIIAVIGQILDCQSK